MMLVTSTASSAQCTVPVESVTATCTISGTATVAGGALAIGAPSSIKWATTLNGYDLNQDGRATITAVNATGSGSGWSVTATITPFTDSSAALKHPQAFRPTQVTLNGSSSSAKGDEAPKETCTATSTCSLADNAVTYPVTVTATCGTSGTGCAPTTVASASTTSGMGAVALAVTAWLKIPADAYAGTYTGTITLTISSGP
ncbi:MAG: hypothetical protein ACLP62_11040 [Acidimicrobiales bacterium]